MSDRAISWKAGGRRPSQLYRDEDIVFQGDARPKGKLPRPSTTSLAPVRDERIQFRQR